MQTKIKKKSKLTWHRKSWINIFFLKDSSTCPPSDPLRHLRGAAFTTVDRLTDLLSLFRSANTHSLLSRDAIASSFQTPQHVVQKLCKNPVPRPRSGEHFLSSSFISMLKTWVNPENSVFFISKRGNKVGFVVISCHIPEAKRKPPLKLDFIQLQNNLHRENNVSVKIFIKTLKTGSK